jgi:hypothetical protein
MLYVDTNSKPIVKIALAANNLGVTTRERIYNTWSRNNMSNNGAYGIWKGLGSRK